MIEEHRCGCIFAPLAGPIRYCNAHVKSSGGVTINSGIRRDFPSYGKMPDNWKGGK